MSDTDRLPEDRQDLLLLVHAMADGELDAVTALALERRMLTDRALAVEYANIVALKEAVGRLPRPPVSPAFAARIAALAVETAASPPGPSKRASFDWRAMAASIIVTAFVASGATYWAFPRQPPASVADAVAGLHRQALLAASPTDILSSDRHTVKPWLDARIGVSPPAVDLSKDGFTLLGGRVDVISGAPVPALVYRFNEHLITLVAIPRQQESGQNTDVTAPVSLSADGFNQVHWTDSAFSYWATSDMEKGELDRFVARFRAEAAAG
jgi:anti-sigma factor RsiW